jgi:hypothetical protein
MGHRSSGREHHVSETYYHHSCHHGSQRSRLGPGWLGGSSGRHVSAQRRRGKRPFRAPRLSLWLVDSLAGSPDHIVVGAAAVEDIIRWKKLLSVLNAVPSTSKKTVTRVSGSGRVREVVCAVTAEFTVSPLCTANARSAMTGRREG